MRTIFITLILVTAASCSIPRPSIEDSSVAPGQVRPPIGKIGSDRRAKAVADLSLDDLFPTDRLLDVQITVEEDDWDTVRNQSRNVLEALNSSRQFEPPARPYTYVEAKVTIDGVEFPRVGIRKKGFIGSQSSERPSLKIKLDFVDETHGIEGTKVLTLNNNKQDLGQISQFMGYDLFNRSGSPAPRCSYAKVSVNGKNLGVYSHVESIRRSMVRRRFGTDKGTLYEGTVVDFYEDWENSFERKFGEDETGREHIKQLIDVLRDDGPDIEKRIAELVDLDSFYVFWAVEGLLGFWDGYSGNSNNFFAYLHPKTGKFHFMPWGADAMFEKYSQLGRDLEAPISVKTKGLIAHRLYRIESCRERYRKTLLGIMKEHWDADALLAETERIERMLDPHLHSRQQNHSASLEKIRNFIRVRKEEILAEISDGMPTWDKEPDPPFVIPAESGEDTIWFAAKTGKLDELKRHLGEGGDVNKHDAMGLSPLSWAALGNQPEAAELLIAKGADVNGKSRDGSAPLHTAAFLGHSKFAELLIEKKASVNLRHMDGQTALDIAASEWSAETEGIMEFLKGVFHLKIDVDEVKAGRVKVAELLRRNGGTNAPKRAVDNTLGELVKEGKVEALEKALAEGADPNVIDDKGITPLSWAAMINQEEAAKALIKAGADVDGKNKDGGAVLHSATFFGRAKMVSLLIESKATVDLKNNRGETALSIASTEWNDQAEGIVRFIAGVLRIIVDVDEVRAGRAKILVQLKAHEESKSE